MIEAEDEKTEGIKRVTLREQGPVLPLGNILSGDKVSRDIDVRDWTFKQERQLGERRKTMGNDGDNMARYVSAVLAAMCPALGGHDFSDSAKQEMNEIKVGQMWLPDVMYAYVWLRYKALGHELPLTLTSPTTKQKFDWVGDLNTLTIKVPNTPADAFWDYNVLAPFEIRGKRITRLKMGPQVWNNVESMNPGVANDATAKAIAIKASIHGVPELSKDPIALVDSDLDNMTKKDIENIARLIDLNGIGPIMVLEVDDPTTNLSPGNPQRKLMIQVDWRYDSFFASSSR